MYKFDEVLMSKVERCLAIYSTKGCNSWVGILKDILSYWVQDKVFVAATAPNA